MQERPLGDFVQCHPQPPGLAVPVSFTLEQLSDKRLSPIMLVTLSSKGIPDNKTLEPCFDLWDRRSSELVTTQIPIVLF